MITQRKLEWTVMALTAGLLILLDWLHLGVIHYNLFLFILLGWSLSLILIFRLLTVMGRRNGNG
jgi:hypothetical protein